MKSMQDKKKKKKELKEFGNTQKKDDKSYGSTARNLAVTLTGECNKHLFILHLLIAEWSHSLKFSYILQMYSRL
jgi:hypothetical protein